MAYKMIAGFGFEEEWNKFIKRHPFFFEKLPLLRDTYTKIFIRTENTDDPSDRIVFYLGRIAVEEFNEILLLCANGYGIGGLKLLRGMFERVTTARYISAHREEAQKFIDFHHVNKRKGLNHLKGVSDINKIFSREVLEQIETDYHRVKPQFMQSSWTKLDLALRDAHGLLLAILECQDKHFNLGLQEEIQSRMSDFFECWRGLSNNNPNHDERG